MISIPAIKLVKKGEQISYEVLAYNEPIANSKAKEQAEKDGYKLVTLELVEVRLTD